MTTRVPSPDAGVAGPAGGTPGRSGAVLIVTVAILVLVMALTVAFLMKTKQAVDASRQTVKQAQAYLLLQGARVALNPTWAGSAGVGGLVGTQTLNLSSVSYSGTNPADNTYGVFAFPTVPVANAGTAPDRVTTRTSVVDRVNGLGWMHVVDTTHVVVMGGSGGKPGAGGTFDRLKKDFDVRYYGTISTSGTRAFITPSTIPDGSFPALNATATAILATSAP